MKYLSYALVYLLLHAVNASGQQFLARHFNTEQGLPHSTVYRILEDKKGFLWFCTDGGVCSFDGHAFTERLVIDDSFMYSSPLSISEDEQGNKIVCSYNDGLYLLSDTGMSKYLPREPLSPKFYYYAVSVKGTMWIAGRAGGEFLYKVKNGHLTRCDIKNDTGGYAFVKKVLLLNGHVFAVSSNGLYTVSNDEIKPFLQHLVTGNIKDLKINKQGQYVIAMKDKVVVADTSRILATYLLDKEYADIIVACDNRDNIWVLLYGQKMLLLRNGDTKDISSMLPSQNLYFNDMVEDREGNMWVATYNEGLYMMPSTDILSYQLNNRKANTHCHSIEPMDSNNMLVGSIGNVTIFKNGRMEPMQVKQLAHDEFVYFAKKVGDAIYIGTPYKLIRKSLKHPYKEEIIEMQQHSGAAAIEVDTKGRIWIGGFEYPYVIENNKLKRLDDDTLFARKRYNAILADSKGNIWMGTAFGLLRYDGKKCHYVIRPAVDAHSYINALCEDGHGRVWAATNGGLVCIENDKLKIYGKKDGMVSNRCMALCADKNHTIWIGTPKGLNYIDLETMEIRAYFDGINRKEVLSIYLRDNTLFLGTTDNLLSINTDVFDNNAAPPPVYINSVRTSKHVVNVPREISVPYNENKMIIDFIAIGYRTPNEIEYRYKVRNLDDNWRVTTNHSIELAALPSGDHMFVLNARKKNGKWSKDIELPIRVSTPFWRNYSFIIVMVAGLAYAIFMLSRRQTERREAKKREQLLLLNKIAYLRQQALAALINPHFIFNCMNSIQHFLNRKDNERANSYLADFAGLIRLTMEHAQEMFIPLDSEINRLQLYLSLEQLRFGDGLSFSITVDEHIDTHTVWIPNMIVQPYVENAIWHGIMPKEGKGVISITFGMQGKDEMRIVVQDNGVGIMQSKKKADDGKKHYGMSLTEERLQLLRQISGQHYSINVNEVTENSECVGTRVEIRVPIELKEFPGLVGEERA